MPPKIGIAYANAGPLANPASAAALAEAAEAHGVESLWTVEHVVVPVGYESEYPYAKSGKMPGGEDVPIPDPLIHLAWLGARTETVKLATGILILPQRNPLVVAKELATLDALSSGRVLLGIGVGWLREEFEALGVPFEARGRRTDEYVAALREVWANDVAEFDGEFTKFAALKSNPKPDKGSIPVIIGGHSEAAARRAARIGDGFFPGRNARHLIEVMIEEADLIGRDHSEIEITVGLRSPDEDPCEVAEKMGAHRIVINPPAYFPADIGPAVERVMKAINC